MQHDVALSKEIDDVNKELELICTKLDVLLIEKSTIDNTCLNGRKLNLNAIPSATLAVHLINFLRGGLTPETTLSRFLEFQDPETWKTVENYRPTTDEHPQRETLTDLTYSTESGIFDLQLRAITKLKGFKIASLNSYK